MVVMIYDNNCGCGGCCGYGGGVVVGGDVFLNKVESGNRVVLLYCYNLVWT
jgi:hypothetical protein